MNADRPAIQLTQGVTVALPPVVRAESSTAFYDYFSASSHTGFETPDGLRVYFYADSTSGQLSFFMNVGEDGNQPKGSLDMTLEGVPAGVAITLQDDAGEVVQTTPSEIVGVWKFNGNTDGGVVSGFPFPGAWTFTATIVSSQSVNQWLALGGADGTSDEFTLTLAEPVTFTAFDSPSACRTNCTKPRCGDGILDGGEVCDDGNNVSGDGCAADCKSFD